MKIAVSTNGQSLDAEVEPRFGRCRYFIIADPDTMQFEVLDNSDAMDAGGAGISAAQVIVKKGVQAVLTGNCGPNAYQVLSPAGVQVITGVSGKVREVIDDYRSGKFKVSDCANVPDHLGIGKGKSRSIGIGRGMGMGRGKGRGGKGSGRMMGTSPGVGPSGNCVCPVCRAKMRHQVGTPCYNLSCPKCGAKIVRG
jgi:predicted Fe-Mo cluster-binding NifX family protein